MAEEIDFHGFVFKRVGKSKKIPMTKKKWNEYYFNLIGGSLHYYKQIDDEKPHASLELKKYKFTANDKEGSEKNFCWTLINDKEDYLFYVDDEADFKEWCTKIAANHDKPPSHPLEKEKKRSAMSKIASKAKKNVGQSLATSTLGKKAIKSKLPDEISNLFNAIKGVTDKILGDPKIANSIEKNLFKIGVKLFFLIDDKKITAEELLSQADAPLRAGLNLFTKCYDAAKFGRNPTKEQLMEKLKIVEKNFIEASAALEKLIKPHLKPKNVALLPDTVKVLANSDFLYNCLQKEGIDEQLTILVEAMENYCAFHYY